MKQFTTAVDIAERETVEDGDVYEFEIDGVKCKAYRPGDGQLGVLMATTGRYANIQDQIAGIINFFASVLDDASQHYVVTRLLDRKDPFGIDQVESIMRWMVEEWTGNPTREPSGSAPSLPSGGQN